MARGVAVVLITALVLAACGGDDDDAGRSGTTASEGGASAAEQSDASEDASGDAAMVTLGDLGLDIPFDLPAELPVPADGRYIGESPISDPYTAAMIATDLDRADIDAAIQAHAEANNMSFDESIAQATGTFELADGPHFVYIITRVTDDTQLVVEIGRLANG